MSVVIPGINLPEYCYDCPCHNGEHGYCQISKEYIMGIERPAKCPLVPVPPHGRLIDVDELFPLYADLLDGRDVQLVIPKIVIDTAPTIIEAEEAPAKDTNVPTYDLLYEEGGAGTT